MPIYTLQAPDGKILTLEGPEGATQDEVIAQAQTLYQPSPAPIETPAAAPMEPAGAQLRPKFQDPVTTMGPFQTKTSLKDRVLSGGRQLWQESYEGGGNLLEYGANAIDDNLNALKNKIALTFIGEDEINRRAMENPQPAQITAAPTNPVSQFLRDKADEQYAGANAMQSHIMMNPVAPAPRETDFQSVLDNPLDAANTFKFLGEEVEAGVGAAAESLPRMAANIPTMGALEGVLQLTGIASDRAENQGRDRRNISGQDLIEASPFAAFQALLERTGIKGLNSKGVNAFTRTGKAAAKEGITEAIQEPTEYVGGVVGTDEKVDLKEAAKRSYEGARSGVIMGGGLKGGAETTAAGGRVIAEVTDLSGLNDVGNYDLSNLGQQGAPSKLPQAPQRPSQDTEPPTAEQATSEPVESPPATPEPATGRQPEAPSQPVASVPPADPPAPTRPEEPTRKKVVTPDGGFEVETQDEVVDLDTLITSDKEGFDPALQPRDRKKATSDIQIQRIAANLDPERLGESRTTDQGSPIVGPDNLVESGNGRTAAIRRAYEGGTPQAEAYRQSLISRGYNVEGIKNPVLIRRRTTELSPEDRVRFTSLSNKSQIAELSSTEKAVADAKQIDEGVLDLHKGGEPDSQDNQDFVRAFIQKVTTGNETGSLIDGSKRLTQEGIKRVKAALVAKAYDNPSLVENIFDSADPEVKSLGNVLRDQAPAFAQLNAAVDAGSVPDRFNITKQLMDAVEIIRNAKRDKKPVSEAVKGTNQTSLIEDQARDPLVDKLVEFMYRPNFGRMLSQPDITRILKQYATQAREQKDSDLFEENKTQPLDLLQSAYDSVVERLEASSDGQGTLPVAADTGSVETKPAAPTLSDTAADERRARPQTGSVDQEELAKTGGRKFKDFATTRSTSRYRTAYVDLGIDPDIATSMPADAQLEILKTVMQDRFGMKVNVSKMLDRRAALDMLHNIYNNLSFISGVFGLPYKAIGLNGTLTLNLQDKLRGALGVYNPNDKAITLPRNSNSFIHEWLHALDDHLLNQFGDVSQGDLFSGVVRKDGIIDPHDGVQAAFANLLHAIFYDKAMLASIKLDLENKLRRARTDASKADIERKLKELEQGNYKGIKGKTNYYQGSKQLGKGNPYWTSPEEMLARVFEAYSAHVIEAAGGDPSSIAKGDMAYLSNVDERLAKTFPKLQERLVIFEAMDQFLARLNESAILGEKFDRTKAMALDDFSILDSADFAYMPEYSPYKGKGVLGRIATFKRNLIDEQKREITRWRAGVVKLKEAIIDKRKAEKENPSSANSSLEWLRGMLFSTDRSVMHALERKYDNSESLKKLNDRVFTRPGQGRVVKQDYFFNTRNTTAQFKKRLGNLMRTFDVARTRKGNAAQNTEIRDILIGAKKTGSEKSKKVAGALRKLLDDMYQELKNAGVDIGYLRDQGYLSRLYIGRKILADKEGFLSKAAQVYGLQFDRDVGEIIDDIMENPEVLIEHLKRIAREGADSIGMTKKEVKELIQALEAGVDEETVDDIRAQLEAALPDIREFYAQTAAADWLHRIQYGSDSDLENGSPSSGFTKKRALPPETDKILEDFMETDPFVIVDHYSDLVGRKVGLEKAINPEGEPSYKELLKRMEREGIAPKDIAIIKNRFDKLLGIDEGQHPIMDAVRPVFSVAHLGGMLSMLDLAAIASLPERFTIIIKTKRVSDLFRTVIYTMDQIAGTDSAKEAREAAESIGIIMNEMAAAALDARMGGWREIDLVEKAASAFFIKNGLAMVDNSNRLVAFRISMGYFKHLSRRLLDPKVNKVDAELIRRELAEYGIDPENAKAFARWLTGDVKPGNNSGVFEGFANVRALQESPFGRDLVLALNRFNDQTVQRPTAADRPYASKNPVGSLVFAVTSFAFAFYENMVKSELKKVAHVHKSFGALQAARQASLMLLSWAPLLAATMITNALRVALLDKERWEELKKEDDVANYLFLRSLSSMGVLGPVVDFLVNLTTGVRYQRDAATSLSGAYISNYLKWLESLIGASNVSSLLGRGDTNSPNTNTQEYNLIKNTWKTMIAPGVALGLSLAPGGKLMSTLAGLGIAGIGSSTLADSVAQGVVGEKGNTKKKNSTEPKEPKGPKEPKVAGD